MSDARDNDSIFLSSWNPDELLTNIALADFFFLWDAHILENLSAKYFVHLSFFCLPDI